MEAIVVMRAAWSHVLLISIRNLLIIRTDISIANLPRYKVFTRWRLLGWPKHSSNQIFSKKDSHYFIYSVVKWFYLILDKWSRRCVVLNGCNLHPKVWPLESLSIATSLHDQQQQVFNKSTYHYMVYIRETVAETTIFYCTTI